MYVYVCMHVCVYTYTSMHAGQKEHNQCMVRTLKACESLQLAVGVYVFITCASISQCVYVCLSLSLPALSRLSLHMYRIIYIYIYMYIYIHINHSYIYVYIYTHAQIHTYIFTYIHAHIHTYIYIYIHTYMCVGSKLENLMSMDNNCSNHYRKAGSATCLGRLTSCVIYLN